MSMFAGFFGIVACAALVAMIVGLGFGSRAQAAAPSAPTARESVEAIAPSYAERDLKATVPVAGYLKFVVPASAHKIVPQTSEQFKAGYLKQPPVDAMPAIVFKGGVHDADKWTYVKGDLKIDCTSFKVEALDTSGKTIASATPSATPEAGTCSYAMRVPANAEITLKATAVGGAPVMRADDTQKWKVAESFKFASDSPAYKTSLKAAPSLISVSLSE